MGGVEALLDGVVVSVKVAEGVEEREMVAVALLEMEPEGVLVDSALVAMALGRALMLAVGVGV